MLSDFGPQINAPVIRKKKSGVAYPMQKTHYQTEMKICTDRKIYIQKTGRYMDDPGETRLPRHYCVAGYNNAGLEKQTGNKLIDGGDHNQQYHQLFISAACYYFTLDLMLMTFVGQTLENSNKTENLNFHWNF